MPTLPVNSKIIVHNIISWFWMIVPLKAGMLF